MSALLSPVQEGKIWRVKIVWPNRAVHILGNLLPSRMLPIGSMLIPI